MDGTAVIRASVCSAGTEVEAATASMGLAWCNAIDETNVFIFLCFIANRMHGISHIMPTELPAKMYMWNITEKRKELFDLFDKGVCGSTGTNFAFGLETSSFFVLRKTCFW